MAFNRTKQSLANFRSWYHRHRKLFWVVSCVVIILVAAGVTVFYASQKPSQPVIIKKAEKPKPVVKYYSPLTGDPVANEAATKLPVTGVMIENSPDARPQSGIKNSGVVFEAIAEAGITRFLVLYQQEKPQLIGPVRSLRQYDIDWLAPFDASIAHVGGSAAALSEIRDGNYRDLDQFFNGDSFWRATDRYAPHNVYTSFDNLDALNKAKGYTTSIFTGFSRTDGKPSKNPDATNINIDISSSLYNSSYIYNASTNSYARSQAGAPHLDREDGQITPNVVVAIRVDESTQLQDGYREVITTTGSGKATIFQNGTATDATWHKASQLGQLYFTDSAGKDIPLVRGQTWIAAVPNNGGDVSWK
ncbi:MAG TPA: DUF3048 domain-containing protein [Candidatus Saccharimonadales bacterium]|nr:DUF3048 domain-containing protein [Candidatus Saccharimonadales bacterium]